MYLDDLQQEDNGLMAFDYPPHNLTKEMLLQWDGVKNKVENNFRSDKKIYHRLISLERLLKYAVPLYMVNGIGEKYEKVISSMFSNLYISGHPEGQIAMNFLHSIEFTMLFMTVGYFVNFGYGINGPMSKQIEETRIEKIRKISKKEIKKLHEYWVKQKLIDENNKAWCIRKEK